MKNQTSGKGGEAAPTHGKENLGLTYRDYFAARAMQALLSKNPPTGPAGWATIAKNSYRMADAMLEERKDDGNPDTSTP